MDKQKRNIIIGAVVGLLAIVVIYLNFFAGSSDAAPSGGDSLAEQAIKAAPEPAPIDTAAPENKVVPMGGGGGGLRKINR